MAAWIDPTAFFRTHSHVNDIRQVMDEVRGAVLDRREAAAANDEPLNAAFTTAARSADYALMRHLDAIDRGYPIDGLAVAAGLGERTLFEDMMKM